MSKESQNDLKILAKETLWSTNTESYGTCFITNRAADKLVEAGEKSLPFIEQVIEQYIVPFITNGKDDKDVYEEFLGIDDLIRSYVKIGHRNEAQRVIEFLKRLPTSIRAMALQSIMLAFRRIDGLTEIREEAPPEYIDFANFLLTLGKEVEKETAGFFFKFMFFEHLDGV